ncbi:hypothetical protein CRG98_010702 [Punica granatum]|uniref:Uncharacterized protein n=1 Tax=Punica granatum TaxID=22663 RepID=A0A2I0KKD7_PUNGR|nr:hypothetical protein CRG98_010702 [Punica granatum]
MNNSKDRFRNEGETNRDSKEVTADSATPLRVNGRVLLDPIRVSVANFKIELGAMCGKHAASRKGEPKGFGQTKEPHGPYCKGDGRGFLGMAEPF